VEGLRIKKYLQSTRKHFDPLALIISVVGLAAVLGSISTVDAKNYTLSNSRFTLGRAELNKALAFEQYTRTPFWFAFRHHCEGDLVWYWISALQAHSTGYSRYNHQTNEEFVVLKVQNFLPVRRKHDINLLFSNGVKACHEHQLSKSGPF